jgi:hypothetical protein
MKKIVYLFVALLSVGCARKTEEARSRTATITLAVIEYEEEIGPIVSSDNRTIFRLLVGENPKSQKIYTPYAEEIMAGAILDSWGREVRFYKNPNGKSIAWSAGPDGTFSDTKEADDILGDYYPVVKSKI